MEKEKLRVLLANDPRTYREAMADAFRVLRPLVEVSLVEPTVLDGEVARIRPHLVVCSGALAAAGTAARGLLARVTLYPDGDDRAEIVLRGERSTLTGVSFGDLLSVVDRIEGSCASPGGSTNGA